MIEVIFMDTRLFLISLKLKMNDPAASCGVSKNQPRFARYSFATQQSCGKSAPERLKSFLSGKLLKPENEHDKYIVRTFNRILMI